MQAYSRQSMAEELSVLGDREAVGGEGSRMLCLGLDAEGS